MKKLIHVLVILIISTSILPSCRKAAANEGPVYVTLDIMLKANQSFEYDLGGFGIEDGTEITKQAQHFITSDAKRNPGTYNIIYTYIPAHNYTGADEVEIKSIKGSPGSGGGNISYTRIKFSIGN